MEIYFICTGNASRSPMAEAIAKREFDNMGMNWNVYSFGMNAAIGEPVSRRANQVCIEIGIDLSKVTRKQLTNELIKDDVIYVVMEQQHADNLRQLYKISDGRIFVLGNVIPDPRDCNLDVYRECRDLLVNEIRLLINKLKSTDFEHTPAVEVAPRTAD